VVRRVFCRQPERKVLRWTVLGNGKRHLLGHLASTNRSRDKAATGFPPRRYESTASALQSHAEVCSDRAQAPLSTSKCVVGLILKSCIFILWLFDYTQNTRHMEMNNCFTLVSTGVTDLTTAEDVHWVGEIYALFNMTVADWRIKLCSRHFCFIEFMHYFL